MRRASILKTQTSEPMIVVEDDEKDDERIDRSSTQSSEDESTSMNPYLLSPYAREIRKHSLPTPQCSGITASQVRRLSERGETAGPGPRQAEFLATLSTAPQPSTGGRRHSVVTISRLPPAFFGRSRRESVATYSSPGRVLPNRRESIACPPSTESRGSVHNLQLDIMDDIVQARKVRMKLWNTSSEKVCEVQDESGGNVQRYTNSGRRFSDFVGTTLAPIPSMSKRRASELPPKISTPGTSKKNAGIVCSNTDLLSILTSLSTSATEINRYESDQENKSKAKNSQLKDHRSNSFDISILQELEDKRESKALPSPSNWFVRRHQPLKSQEQKFSQFSNFKDRLIRETKKIVDSVPGKVMWDEKSGSLVDPTALGNAIEVFLRKTSPESSGKSDASSSPTKSSKLSTVKTAVNRSKTWFSKGDEDSTEACESSICSTLKDLFVK